MNPFRFLPSQGPTVWVGLLAGAVLIFPSAGPGHDTLTRTVKHGVPVKPPVIPPASASVIPSDPVPNTEDPVSGAPLDGGIRYAWTVNLAGNTSASFDGATGAWGWDADGGNGHPLGRTEAATWVALDLKSPSRLTIRVERKPQAIDARSLFPGDTAGANLRPAFTLLSGWDSDGGDEATFSNRGHVAWAEDTDYLDHVESGTEVAEGTFELDAGLYTVVLGGNSTSLLPEGRQGYGARLTSVSLEKAPGSAYQGGKNQVTSRPAMKLSGRAGVAGEITTLRILHHGKTRLVPVKGSAWSAMIKGLEFGKNTIWITPVSKYGTVFPAQRVKVMRK
jgi:hypothetical protein